MPHSLFVGITICTDCMGDYNSYKTRKQKTYRPIGYKSVYQFLHKPAKPAKDKIEPINCSPHEGPNLEALVNQTFQSWEICSGDLVVTQLQVPGHNICWNNEMSWVWKYCLCTIENNPKKKNKKTTIPPTLPPCPNIFIQKPQPEPTALAFQDLRPGQSHCQAVTLAWPTA